MGTGILASLNRNGAITPLIRLVDLVKSPVRDDHTLEIQDETGVLCSASHLTDMQKEFLANRRNYQSRSEIALDVCAAYPGGDYFEFGCAGLYTFRSFLGAFQIYHRHTKHFPSTRFYAFDIFGNPDRGSGPRGEQQYEKDYFEAHRLPYEAAAPTTLLKRYRELNDRCVLVPGYFQDTLTEEFKMKMRTRNQKIGFAFVDVNIAGSYKCVFDFLLDVMHPNEKMFIYIDEYFMDAPVALLYQMFADEAKKRHNLHSLYMRNAGNFGALFCLMPPPIAAYDSFFPHKERLR
jgi:hypothetical protein